MPRAQPKSRNNVASVFFNAVHLLTTYLTASSNMEAPNFFLARAQSNLGTSLCHNVDSSQRSHLWCLHPVAYKAGGLGLINSGQTLFSGQAQVAQQS